MAGVVENNIVVLHVICPVLMVKCLSEETRHGPSLCLTRPTPHLFHEQKRNFLEYFISYFSRRHSYSQLLKPIRTCQPTQDESLTNSPSMSVLHP